MKLKMFGALLVASLMSPIVILLSTGNCKIINLSEENILWGFKI